MNKENETISDIVAEMKNLVKSNGTKSRTNIPTLTIRAWLSLADRIEAAYNRLALLTPDQWTAVAQQAGEIDDLKRENDRLRAALKLVLERKVLGAMTAETESGEADYCSNIIFKAQRIYNEGANEAQRGHDR